MAEPEWTAATLVEQLYPSPAGKSWSVAAVAGAHSNRVWHASQPRRPDCIVKHHRPDRLGNPLFGNDIDRECEAARRAPVGLVPILLARRGNWTVWEHRSGGARHAPEQAAWQLGAVHALRPWTGLEVVSGAPSAWVQEGLEMLESAPATAGLARLHSMAPDARAGLHRCTVVHRDPHPGNWVGGQAAMLIDWQCVALGNPLEDFACYLSRGMRIAYGFEPAPPEWAARFLRAANIDPGHAWLAAQAAWDFRFACYCTWRAAVNPGRGHYQRALDDYVSRAEPVSKPSIDTALRSRQ